MRVYVKSASSADEIHRRLHTTMNVNRVAEVPRKYEREAWSMVAEGIIEVRDVKTDRP